MTVQEVYLAVRSLYDLYGRSAQVKELVTELDTLRAVVYCTVRDEDFELVWYNEGWQL